MRVTALVENRRLENRKDLRVESGLSLHINYTDRRILFDTGLAEAFRENAEKLEVDIEEVDMGVISHHHHDHGGGLAHFMEVNRKASVYLRQCEEREYHFRALGIINEYVGLDVSIFEKYPERFVFVKEFIEISPDIFILTEIEKHFPLPKGNRHLFAKRGDSRELDRFDHELIMVIREEEGLVVFTGCSHSGLLNIIDTVTKRFPGARIKAVFGGFHLVGLPLLNTIAGGKREVEKLAEDILKYPIDKLYTGHCTGIKAFRILKRILGERLEYLPTGRSVEV